MATRGPQTIGADDLAAKALDIMEGKITSLIVVDETPKASRRHSLARHPSRKDHLAFLCFSLRIREAVVGWYRNCTVPHMRNLARGILVVVVLFVVAVTVTLFAKSRAAGIEPVGPALTTADLQVKEVDLEEEAKGCAGGSRRSRP